MLSWLNVGLSTLITTSISGCYQSVDVSAYRDSGVRLTEDAAINTEPTLDAGRSLSDGEVHVTTDATRMMDASIDAGSDHEIIADGSVTQDGGYSSQLVYCTEQQIEDAQLAWDGSWVILVRYVGVGLFGNAQSFHQTSRLVGDGWKSLTDVTQTYCSPALPCACELIYDGVTMRAAGQCVGGINRLYGGMFLQEVSAAPLLAIACSQSDRCAAVESTSIISLDSGIWRSFSDLAVQSRLQGNAAIAAISPPYDGAIYLGLGATLYQIASANADPTELLQMDAPITALSSTFGSTVMNLVGTSSGSIRDVSFTTPGHAFASEVGDLFEPVEEILQYDSTRSVVRGSTKIVQIGPDGMHTLLTAPPGCSARDISRGNGRLIATVVCSNSPQPCNRIRFLDVELLP